MIKQLIVCTLLCAMLSTYIHCQSSTTFGNSFGGTPGISSSSGVQGGNFNSYAQNTQAYNNQISATNYSPYSSFGSFAQSPAAWGTSYGNSFVNPVVPYPSYGYGGYPCGGYGCGAGYGGWGGIYGGVGYGAGFGYGGVPYGAGYYGGFGPTAAGAAGLYGASGTVGAGFGTGLGVGASGAAGLGGASGVIY